MEDTTRRTPWPLALGAVALLGFGLIAAACSNDDDDDGTNGDDNGAVPTTGTNGDDEPTTPAGSDNGDNGDMSGGAVSISATGMDPATLSVTTGTTVTLTNDDTVAHTVMVDGEEEGEVEAGESLDITFDAAGEFEITTDALEGMGVMVTVS